MGNNTIKIIFAFLVSWNMSHGYANEFPSEPVVNYPPTVTDKENNNDKPEKMASPKMGESSVVHWLTSFEFWMSFSVLCFSVIVFVIEAVMVKFNTFQPEQTIRLLAVTLIVISTLFIITAGFDSEQIAPAMGLFGTIAGYILGRAIEK